MFCLSSLDAIRAQVRVLMMQRRRRSTLQLTGTSSTEMDRELWDPRKSHRWRRKSTVQLTAILSCSPSLTVCFLCASLPGCRELFGGLCVCGDGGPGVHGEGRCQVPHRALRGQSDGQHQQEDHLPGAGQRQRSLQAREGDRQILTNSDLEKNFLKTMRVIAESTKADFWMTL